ncbi:hypothetical protein ABPG74_020868 [Tetrahymena malaccensis]
MSEEYKSDSQSADERIQFILQEFKKSKLNDDKCKEQINNFQTQLKEEIENEYNIIEEKVKSVISNEEQSDLQGLKSRFVQLQFLSKIYPKLEQKFTNLVNLVNQKIGKIISRINQMIRELQSETNGQDLESYFQNLEETFNLIQGCQWIQELDQEQEYDTQRQKVYSSLKKFANLMIGKLDSIEVTLDYTEDISRMTGLNEKMKKLKVFEKFDNELKNILKEYEDAVDEKFEIYFAKAKELSISQEISYWEYQQCYLFIQKCVQCKINKKETQKLLQEIKTNFINSCQQKEISLLQSFDQLKDIFQDTSEVIEERKLIEDSSKNIYQMFEEMQKIEKFIDLKNILEYSRSSFFISQKLSLLKSLWRQIKEIIDNNKHIQQKWIFILQQFKVFDELECSSQNSFCFANLLSEAYSKNKLNVQNLKNGLVQQLNNNHLPNMLATYKQLQESANYNKENKEHQMILNDLKFQLENEMKKVITQVQQYIDKLKQIITYSPINSQFKEQIENANQIIHQYKYFNDFVDHFKGYLDIDKFKSDIEQVQKGITQIVNEGPKKIQQTFKNNNFKESNDQMNFMLEIFKILQQQFPIDEQFKQLRQTQENCFQELQEKVENLRLDNPRSERFDLNMICTRLESVEDDFHNVFSKSLQDIVQKKLEDKLESARDKSLSAQEEIIRQVQQYIDYDYIPKHMQKSLSQLIEKMNNNDKIQEEIDSYQKQKNYIGLKKLQEVLADTTQFKQFKNQYEEFMKKEIDQSSSQCIYNSKQYNNFEKSILNLIKIGVNSPSEYQFQVKEKLNFIFEQLFCDQIKEAENLIQNILNQKIRQHEKSIEFFSHYCQLSSSLLKVQSKLQELEVNYLKELENFYIFDQIQVQKLKITNNLKQRIKQIQMAEDDFTCFKDQLSIIFQLQSFDSGSYHELVEILNTKKQKLQKQMESIIQKNINEFTIQKEYEQYYESFQKGLKNSQEMHNLVAEFNITSLQTTLFQDYLQKLNQIINDINQQLKQCFQGDIFDDDVVKSINNIYLNSKFIDQYFSSMDDVKARIDERIVQSEFLAQIQKLFKEPTQTEKLEINEITGYISNMHRISSTFIYMEKVKTQCNENINQVLKNYKDSKGSIEKLQIQLKKSKYGNQITKDHSFFKGFQICDTNLRIQRFGIDQVIEQTKGYCGIDKVNDLDKTSLNDYYQRFFNKYNEYLENYLTNYDKIDFVRLVKQIQNSVNKLNIYEFQETGKIDSTALAVVADLLAGIFCCWTCINSKYYFESIDQSYENKQSFLIKPHPAQVVAIFRLLGIGYSTNYDKIEPNSLAQVLTGEGKSVILAALACFYSLCGFAVKCACYSNQLSIRDYEEFLFLFQKLQIKNVILYGTFNKVCEQILNQRGDIREQVSSYIQTGKINFEKSSDQLKQVLLIDEVDVFFSKDFFGNNYDIVAPIQDPTIENLLDKIWSAKFDPNFNFKTISESEQYKNCLTKFPNWTELIEEQTKLVVTDFKNFNNVILESYKIQNDKIYYKNQDQYLDNISYGYRTLYTYYTENQNQKISNPSLQKQKVFKINSGSFSYSELPKKFFIIKGVTGTLETLSKSQLELIQNNYNMKQYTLIPSVYGKSKFQFNPQKDVKVVPQEEYYNTITNEINRNMIGKNSEKRAVLVFFETKEILLDYYNSQQFKILKQNSQTYIMTEENSIDERKKIIKDATYSGAITLLTKIFGRGIDFQVNDTVIIQNYGIHVIQTFFSEDKSEETQTKGRTGRQGEEGTFSMVLKQDSLQGFLKTEEDQKKIQRLDEIYEILDKNRQVNFENDFKSNLEYNQKTSITSHKQSEHFLNFLKDCNLQEVKKYLLQLNLGPKEKTFKTLIAMDITGSMGSLITQTKNTIQTTFEQTRDILKQKGYDPQCFLIMISCFRSYNSRWSDIFQTSTWENNPDKLRSFLQTINASGGTGPGESVEVGLWWANKQNEEDPISQVIILGDQPAHLQNEAQQHRSIFGQGYWDSTPLKGLTYYVPECQKLSSKKIPANTFYLRQQAKNTFEEIAKLTNGVSSFLDINSTESSKKLTNIFVEQILIDIGKQDGRSNELIAAYKAKYS